MNLSPTHQQAEDRSGEPGYFEDLANGTLSDREWVAGDRLCPAEILARLAEDEEDLVRHSALRNPSTPVAVMRRAFNRVTDDARSSPVNMSVSELEDLARNPSAPMALLNQMMTFLLKPSPADGQPQLGSAAVVDVILTRPHCPPSRLLWAVRQPVGVFRHAAAGNKNLPAAAIAVLLKRGDPDELTTLGKNSAIASEGKEAIIPLVKADALRVMIVELDGAAKQRCIDRIMTEPDMPGVSAGLLTVVGIHCVDPAQVHELCWRDDWQVREAAGRNTLSTEADRIAITLRGRT